MNDKIVKALEQARRDHNGDHAVRPLARAPRVAEPVISPAKDISLVASPVVTHAPVNAVRPLRSPADGIDAHLVSLLDPISPWAEQYRTLRYIVEQAHRIEQVSIIAVSAPALGDGKTTTAINLAGALAQASDARVVLIDADLRRPALHRYLGLGEARRGLVDAILDPTLTLVDVVRPCPPFNLSVLPAGTPSPSPYELLKSPRFGRLLEEARLQYEYVIVDTPPLVPIPDCRIIGKHVDGFLFVVRAHKTRTKVFDEAARVLDSSKVVGVIFNGSDEAALRDAYAGYAPDEPEDGASARGVAWRRGVTSDVRGFFGSRRDKHRKGTVSR
jgi:capsular exopolysaccharide synthesis family protein